MMIRAVPEKGKKGNERDGAQQRFLPDCAIRAMEGEGNERKFTLSFSSEEPYDRWFGTEILSHSEGAVDLSRLNSIGCVLYNHNRDKVVGKIVRAWIEGGRGNAEIEFDKDADSETVFQKVAGGTLKGVSVGYLVDVWEDVAANKKSSDGRFTGPCSIATKWTPHEVSIVSIPADPTVGVGRSQDDGDEGTAAGKTAGEKGVSSFYYYEKQLQINQNSLKGGKKNMNLRQMIQRQQELLNAAKAASRELTAQEQAEYDGLQKQIDAALAAMDGDGEGSGGNGDGGQEERSVGSGSEEGVAQERQRCADITALCRSFRVPEANISRYISDGVSVDKVREAILDGMIQEGSPISQGGRAEVTSDAADKFRAAAGDALVMRAGIELSNPAEGARELVGMSLRDMAIESLAAEGHTGLNRRSSEEIYNLASRQFFNPTAAFPTILDNAINKAYVEGHKNVAVTFDRWTKKGSLKDFKTADNNYLAGPAGEFLEVPEGGELKHDVPGDVKRPTRKLKTYGRQFTLTRQAFINDDIDLVTRIPARYAASARKTINKQCCQIMVNNPAIYDGTVLFSKAHGNLVKTGTGITQASMQIMLMALQTQKDEFGEAIIVRPAKILVPVGYAFDMYTMFYSPTINTEGNTQAVNPLYRYREQIEIIEEPTLNVLCGGFGNVMPWFLIGAADDTDFIEVDYLNGQEIPTIRRMETPGTLGFIWDIYLDWGISVMDYRGAVKNPGVAISNPLD